MHVKLCKSIHSASFLKSQKLKITSTKLSPQIHLDAHADTPRCITPYIKVYGQVNRGEKQSPRWATVLNS